MIAIGAFILIPSWLEAAFKISGERSMERHSSILERHSIYVKMRYGQKST